MEYLAVKFKDNADLFTQSRKEREITNSVLIDKGVVIETIVVKSFDVEIDAKMYCLKINLVNDYIDNL